MSLEETRPLVACLRSGHEKGGSCPDSRAVLHCLPDAEDLAAALGGYHERLAPGSLLAASHADLTLIRLMILMVCGWLTCGFALRVG